MRGMSGSFQVKIVYETLTENLLLVLVHQLKLACMLGCTGAEKLVEKHSGQLHLSGIRKRQLYLRIIIHMDTKCGRHEITFDNFAWFV